jgi:hypothetical protein
MVDFYTDKKSVTAMNGRNQILPQEQREATAGWRHAFQTTIAPQPPGDSA